MGNEIMTLKGFTRDDSLNPLQRDQPFSDQPQGKHYGMPVSTCKFLTMLFDFWRQNQQTGDNPFGDVFWVNFSKASLFRMLAQEETEFVRFYFALPTRGVNKASLAMEAVKKNGSPVKLDQILAVAGTMTGGNDHDPEGPHPKAGQTIQELTNGNPPGNNEEKGNGGPPLDGGSRNISSLKEFFDMEKDLGKKTFKEFIKAYYHHSQETF